MDSVGHMADRHLGRWPARKQRLKQTPADGAMQPADAIDRAASAQREIRHIEGFLGIARIAAVPRPSAHQRRSAAGRRNTRSK